MIKALILMNLVFFTFEIDHCFEVETACKKCISGYKLVNSPYGAYCQKEEDFNRESGNIDHCLYSYGGHCYTCEKGMLQQQMEDAKRILSIVLYLMVIHVLNVKAIIN